MAKNRASEGDIALGVMQFLASQPSGSAAIVSIKKGLPNYVKLTADDRTQSDTRPNEELWEQQVRNLVSHRQSNGNAVNDGLLAYSPRRLTLTDAGRFYLKSKGL